MTDPKVDLSVVRTQILAAADRRVDERRRALRRGWLLVALGSLALVGSTVAIGAGVFDDGSAKIVTRDLKRIAALSPKAVRLLPTVVPGRTIRVFTKAEVGFDVDVVPTSGGGVCMVIRHATAVIGTDHAETCGIGAQTGTTKGPALSVISPDGGGEAFGVSPPGATSGVFTIRGHAIPLIVHDGYWAVIVPKPAHKPSTPMAATEAFGRGHASFR